MRNESTYQVPIILTIAYRKPVCSIDRDTAQEELVDILSEHQDTIAKHISDLLDLDVEVEDILNAHFEGSRVLV
jgi:hypothetical protein